MASLEEFESSMTIFYYKSDGEIHSYCTGISDMRFFGKRQADYSLIIDYIVCPLDKMVLNFLSSFYVDVKTKQLRLKDNGIDFSKYQ